MAARRRSGLTDEEWARLARTFALVDGYSARSAADGSILVARRAGSHAAISPTCAPQKFLLSQMLCVGAVPRALGLMA
jgi:hypothetical protein